MAYEQTFILVGLQQHEALLKVLGNLPLDGTMEVIIRNRKKQRTKDHNALMWAFMLADISKQAWVNGKQYSSDIWHQHLKREFLPEGNEEDFDRMVTSGYKKWEEMPNGDRVMIGSTTKLTNIGMMQYLRKCESFAVHELGVRFLVAEYAS